MVLLENKGMEKEKSTNIYVKVALTILVLFVLPLGSIYFLNEGRDYRRESISELEDMGKLNDFQVADQHNVNISPDVLRSRVAVVNFLPQDEKMAREQSERIGLIQQSFDDTEDVLFLSFIPEDTSKSLLERAKKLGINDQKQWHLIAAKENDWDKYSKGIFKLPGEYGVALVDTSGTIRHHYDINSNPDMGRLVEHISIVIPKQKRRGL